jgi:phage shock protein C
MAMSERNADTPRRGGGNGPKAGDFQESVARLERAVQDLVATAREQVSDRATAFLDETTTKLEAQLDRRQPRTSAAAPSAASRMRAPTLAPAFPRKLYLDPERKRIVGVCAGIARYYAVEPWVVRCIAVTGLLFFPSIVFPAYWVAYFVMPRPPDPAAPSARRREVRERRDHRSPAPELGPRLSPRNSLRNVQADLMEAELRLRRMETHVTSGRYELQREFQRIDVEPAPGARN